MTVGAVIVAAGRGERFGGGGKVLAPVAGRPMLAWSLDAFDRCEAVREIVIVAGEHTIDPIRNLVDTASWRRVTAIVPGGADRSASVAAGIAALAPDTNLVAIHDAARPLVTVPDIEAAIAAAEASGAAIVATPVTDTIKRCSPELTIERTVDRTTLWAAQTPQAFRLDLLRRAFASAAGTGATDEAMLFEALGLPVRIVPGRRDNMKVTVPEDLPMADFLMRRRLETA